MEGGNFHLIFTRRCPLTFCSTLRYHVIFEETIEEASSHSSTNLSYIHLETPVEAIYPDAREISSRSGLATPKTIATPDLYHPILLLLYGALRNYAHPSFFPYDVLSRINTYTYQR